MIRVIRTAAVAVSVSMSVCFGGAAGVAASEPLNVIYLKLERPPVPTLSNLDPIPDDLGAAGARLGLADNQTTGQFLGHDYDLNVVVVPLEDDPLAAAEAALTEASALILDAPTDVMLAIADLPGAAGALLFNATERDVDLRDAACRGNLLHTIPSHAMLADGVTQFLMARRWTKTAMIAGPQPEDQALATAFEASLRKFGLKPGKRADWTFETDIRRAASQEVPLFTQPLGDYDVLLIADQANDFARYVAYNTWLPRPLAGSAGITATAWSRVVEQWGAAQLQSRFQDVAGRAMQAEDYAAWAAMRTLGEARTRSNGTTDIGALRTYILSDAFELAGFKGRPLSYRNWNGQLRQPIPLVHAGAVIAQTPIEEFLHQHNELDTLGLDAPNSACAAFED